ITVDPNTNIAYVPGDNAAFSIDVSNPAAPRVLVDDERYCCWQGAKLIGSFGFSSEEYYPYTGVTWTDVRDPDLLIAGRISFPSFEFDGTAVQPSADLVYAIGDVSGGRPMNFNTPPVCRFAVGRWRTLTETNGTSPLAVVTSPANGVTFLERQSVPITVNALDDVGVASVAIAVDGQTLATLTVPPFAYLWDAPVGAGQHTITATATDFGGHSTTSGVVTINVTGDTTTPVVHITSPAVGASVTGPSVVLRASAADNLAVAAVTFLVDGQPVGTVTASPYELPYTIPAGTLAFHVSASAVDPAGNTGQSEDVAVNVVPAQILGSLALPAGNRRVAMNGPYAYVANATSGLVIVDISNPASPTITSSLAFPNGQTPYDVRVYGHFAYVATSSNLYEVDVTNPQAPVILRTFAGAVSVDVAGTRAYIVLGGSLSILDLSDPAAMTLFGTGSTGYAI
ncbi:MAG TPA: Ig-like domain-containing protein, partial [Mycobacteriales bacterium]|nr:Ig-like domain-containing protein [Mycobacteriales bacterium]